MRVISQVTQALIEKSCWYYVCLVGIIVLVSLWFGLRHLRREERKDPGQYKIKAVYLETKEQIEMTVEAESKADAGTRAMEKGYFASEIEKLPEDQEPEP